MANPITGMFQRPFKQRANARKLMIHAPNGIREEGFVTIGGIEQWVTIRGQDKNNPILFMLHGGPGSPYTPFNSWLGEWERYFTVVQWDQRGGGKTFIKNGKDTSAPLTMDMLASDGIDVAAYALRRLNQSKLLLVGSSAGSYVGLMMAKRRPDLFTAYIGTDQNSPGGWELSFKLTQEAARKAGDKKSLRTLAAITSDRASWTRDQHLAMNKIAINHTKQAPNMIYDLMLPALLFTPDYKMSDVSAIDKGMQYSSGQLFESMKNFDFDAIGYTFDVPFFVLQGAEDLITPPASAKAYVERIAAPIKGFIPISAAAHVAAFCNPHEFLTRLLEIQKKVGADTQKNARS